MKNSTRAKKCMMEKYDKLAYSGSDMMLFLHYLNLIKYSFSKAGRCFTIDVFRMNRQLNMDRIIIYSNIKLFLGLFPNAGSKFRNKLHTNLFIQKGKP